MKGQVTLFIVLGIIVMIIIGLGLFVKDLIFDAQIAESADTLFREFEQSSSLNTYLKSCIRKVTNNGLTLLGVQGGYIYVDQGGTQERPRTMQNIQPDFRGVDRSFDLAYWIFDEIENYGPVQGFKFDIPKLCSNTGPNKLGASENSVNTCQLLDVYGSEGRNIQDSLAAYIDNSLPECLDLDIYATTRGNEVVAEAPKSEIIFNKDSFLVSTSYPFKINIKGRDPEIKITNYTYESDARLQSAYLLMKVIAEEESINPRFNPQEDFFDLSYYKSGFIVQVIPDWNNLTINCEEDCFDDLVWLKDESTFVNGKPFELMFAIEDRRLFDGIDFDEE